MGAVRTILNRQEEDSFRLPLAAVDPESADFMIAAARKRLRQRMSVVHKYIRQMAALFHGLKLGYIGCRCSSKFDRRSCRSTT